MKPKEKLKVGDKVLLRAIPESVQPDEDADSTYSVLTRMLQSRAPRTIHEIDEHGLVELRSYRVADEGDRVYHSIWIEPECVELISPAEAITDTAERFSRAVVESIADGSKQRLSFVGMRGITSTYFNIILQGVVEAYGLPGLDLIEPEFDTETQRRIWDHAVEATKRH